MGRQSFDVRRDAAYAMLLLFIASRLPCSVSCNSITRQAMHKQHKLLRCAAGLMQSLQCVVTGAPSLLCMLHDIKPFFQLTTLLNTNLGNAALVVKLLMLFMASQVSLRPFPQRHGVVLGRPAGILLLSPMMIMTPPPTPPWLHPQVRALTTPPLTQPPPPPPAASKQFLWHAAGRGPKAPPRPLSPLCLVFGPDHHLPCLVSCNGPLITPRSGECLSEVTKCELSVLCSDYESCLDRHMYKVASFLADLVLAVHG